jgi:hypothetical protein
MYIVYPWLEALTLTLKDFVKEIKRLDDQTLPDKVHTTPSLPDILLCHLFYMIVVLLQ